ncbi:hypothetical protein, conserved [Trypanosoma brucei gambiense DAL972]|uniref:Transcription and mRNA export factor ENY2 n=2 Tax=Trypanosoma brucei TaxID=5691 RepID=C9ZTQ3_TRYB9|nr:hypothetical protein, conserved [Trypanosoma brucei gambiense DAL972]RHW71485.1 Transcription factor e(y)2 [Trypanosoma brucei equiperdum]CBH12788.1 hypothetical protein, conserved [Trypanosoma brucei gambiense DAL972]|eukprot:XP_011775068.1 hypothetical protein, conserved [Trypanosoma brucei gambiense DAL972]
MKPATIPHGKNDAEGAGARMYEGMNTLQKEELNDYLISQMGPGTKWHDEMSDVVNTIIRQRSINGEPLDVHDVLSEALPHCQLAISHEVRDGLFRRIAGMCTTTDG